MVVKLVLTVPVRIWESFLLSRLIQNVRGVEVIASTTLQIVMLAHLLKYDTTRFVSDGTVEVKEGGFEVINGKFVKFLLNVTEQIDWATDSVEIVLEATGFLC